jgi:hypothetical protein
MSPEIVALIAVFAVGMYVGVQFEKTLARERRTKWRRENRRDTILPFAPKQDAVSIVDAADQLRTVMKADFKAQRLLNKSETRLFKAIDKMVLGMRPDWQVMAQVSLGEILKCEDKAAYACINSKRVDLLIVDDECRPLHAIEYQGGAHFKGAHATAARDAVKKEALRRAGIGYVEVVAGDTPAELRRVVQRLLQGQTP